MTFDVCKNKCAAKTAKGSQCSRSAFENEIYCKIHINKYSKMKSSEKEREVRDVIYHTHPPSKKIYPNCPRCNITQTSLCALSLPLVQNLKI